MTGCPNDPPCEHYWHDIYELGDPYPTCCEEDCPCGKPGDATCVRLADGTVTVERADPVIRVTRELLDAAEPWVWDAEREVLQLDTAGEYRYALLRTDPDNGRVAIFGRVK